MPRPERDRSSASRSTSARIGRVGEQRVAQLDRAVDGACRPRAGPTSRSACRPRDPSSRQRPDRVEVLEREAERIHHAVAAVARRVARGAPRAARARSRLLRRPRSRRAPRRSAAAPPAACPGSFSRIHAPRSTGDVRFGIRRGHQHAALAEQAEAVLVRELDAAERARRARRRCRSAARGARSRTCVRRQEVEHAAVLEQTLSRNSSSLGREACAEMPRSNSRKSTGSGAMSSSFASAEPLVREVRRRAMSSAGPRACAAPGASSTADRASLPARASSQQLLVGHRCSTGRTTAATRARGRSTAYDEPGAQSSGAARRDRGTSGSRARRRARLDAVFEAAGLGAPGS